MHLWHTKHEWLSPCRHWQDSCACMCAHIHAHTRTHVRAHTHARTHTHAHTHTHTRTHTHTNTCAHTYTYAHTHAQVIDGPVPAGTVEIAEHARAAPQLFPELLRCVFWVLRLELRGVTQHDSAVCVCVHRSNKPYKKRRLPLMYAYVACTHGAAGACAHEKCPHQKDAHACRLHACLCLPTQSMRACLCLSCVLSPTCSHRHVQDLV